MQGTRGSLVLLESQAAALSVWVDYFFFYNIALKYLVEVRLGSHILKEKHEFRFYVHFD